MLAVLLFLGCVAATPAAPTAFDRQADPVLPQTSDRDTGPCAAPLQAVFDALPADPVSCGDTFRAMRVVFFNTSNCSVTLRDVSMIVDVYGADADDAFLHASLLFDDGSMLGTVTPLDTDGSVTFSGTHGLNPHEALFASLWTTLKEDCGGTAPEEFTPILLSDQIGADRSDGSLVTWIVPMSELEGAHFTVE